MSVNLSGLLVLLIGVPLLLVAGGLLLNAYLMVRRQNVETADMALEALATESMDELLLELQHAIEEIKGQLARQRVTLSGLLTEAGGIRAAGRRDATTRPDTGLTTGSAARPRAAAAGRAAAGSTGHRHPRGPTGGRGSQRSRRSASC